jgi:ornithine cyclodeaminase/alanine dehydrogenase-like protein (mu-crystallin family)
MDETIAAVEEVLAQQAAGEAASRPRQRVQFEGRVYHTMPAGAPGIAGLKTYLSGPGGTRFAVLLFSTETGALLAMMEADWLGRLRTGAASGVATRYLARPEATVAGLFGAGGQAETQLQAVCAVRDIALIKVYSRTREALRGFCERMSQVVPAEVVPMTHVEAVVEGSDVLITATTAREPLFDGGLVSDGAHLNLIGSNWADRREVDAATIRRADLIAVDSIEQARIEAGDLLLAEREGVEIQPKLVELGQIVAGRQAGRTSPIQVTLFKSVGIALEDIAAAARVYRKAVEAGVGQEVNFLG